MTPLPDIIADLRARLDALPRIDGIGGDWVEQHRAHRAAATALADHLTDAYGALVRERPDTNTVTIKGIKATGTAGLHGALHNWIAAAERRLERDRT